MTLNSSLERNVDVLPQKKPNRPDRASLVPIESTYPFEMVSVDCLHLDRCSGGFEYALVVCDHFTRFVQIYPTKTKSAKLAAEKLYNDYILNYGFPRRIHHDRGREFNNELLKIKCFMWYLFKYNSILPYGG